MKQRINNENFFIYIKYIIRLKNLSRKTIKITITEVKKNFIHFLSHIIDGNMDISI